MAHTDIGIKWETEKSKIFIFAFFPVLQAIPFFYMDSTIENKKWRKEAYATLITSILLVLIGTTFITLAGLEPYYVDTTDEPYVEQYITEYEFQQKYADEIKNDNLVIGDTLEEQKYQDAHSQWYKKEDIQRMEEKNDSFSFTMIWLGWGSFSALFLLTFVMIFVAFSERTKFLKMLAPASAQALTMEKYNPYMATANSLANEGNKKQVISLNIQPDDSPSNQPPAIPNNGKRNIEL